MKLKRLFWASSLLVFLTSCVSKPIPIPGDYQKTKDNLYNEYMEIANAYFDLEKYDKAIAYYKLCLEKKSLYWGAYYKLAKTYAIQSNWSEAEPMYKEIYKRDPANNSIKASLAYIYAMEGNSEQALSMYNELIQEHPENKEYLENYIAIQILSEDFTDIEAAMALLNKDFPDSENLEKFNNKIQSILDERKASQED